MHSSALCDLRRPRIHSMSSILSALCWSRDVLGFAVARLLMTLSLFLSLSLSLSLSVSLSIVYARTKVPRLKVFRKRFKQIRRIVISACAQFWPHVQPCIDQKRTLYSTVDLNKTYNHQHHDNKLLILCPGCANDKHKCGRTSSSSNMSQYLSKII